MNKRYMILLLWVIIVRSILYSQVQFYIQIPDYQNTPSITKLKNSDTIQVMTKSSKENAIYSKYKLKKFEKAFPTAKSEYLQHSYIIECDSLGLMHELMRNFSDRYADGSEILKPVPLYTPNDFGIVGGYTGNEQRNLDLMRIREAWDLTKGDPNFIIGITDTYLDTGHEDIGKIIEIRGANTRPDEEDDWLSLIHGTATTGVMAGLTNNSLGIAAPAINCNVLFSSIMTDEEVLLLSQQGVKVINCSWFNGCDTIYRQRILYEEVRQNGTLVIAGAGNTKDHCYGLDSKVYPASYESVMSVTGVGHQNETGTTNVMDVHEYLVGDSTRSFHHNDAVDICAPGYEVIVPLVDGGTYAKVSGTSISTPQVAGTAALMLSANPCLSPDELQKIIENTAADIYQIPANQRYIGRLGAGRIDAYEAVREAAERGTTYLNNISYYTTATESSQYKIQVNNTTVYSGSNVTFRARHVVELRSGFEVKPGGLFEMNANINYQIDCQ